MVSRTVYGTRSLHFWWVLNIFLRNKYFPLRNWIRIGSRQEWNLRVRCQICWICKSAVSCHQNCKPIRFCEFEWSDPTPHPQLQISRWGSITTMIRSCLSRQCHKSFHTMLHQCVHPYKDIPISRRHIHLLSLPPAYPYPPSKSVNDTAIVCLPPLKYQCIYTLVRRVGKCWHKIICQVIFSHREALAN